MDLLESGPGYSALEDAIVLFCVYIEGFIVDEMVVLDVLI